MAFEAKELLEIEGNKQKRSKRNEINMEEINKVAWLSTSALLCHE